MSFLFEIEKASRNGARRGRPAATKTTDRSTSPMSPVAVGVPVAADPIPTFDPEPAFTVVARGVPAPQGSKRIGRGKEGQPIVIDDNAKTKPWRKVVEGAARLALWNAGIREPFDGPLRVEVTFTVPKPSSAPKRRRIWPATKPDVDKLQRATFDALTIAGVWREDSRLQKVSAEKVYPGEPGEHGWALDEPGARVRVWLVSEVWPHLDAHARVVARLIDAHRDEYDGLFAEAVAA